MCVLYGCEAHPSPFRQGRTKPRKHRNPTAGCLLSVGRPSKRAGVFNCELRRGPDEEYYVYEGSAMGCGILRQVYGAATHFDTTKSEAVGGIIYFHSLLVGSPGCIYQAPFGFYRPVVNSSRFKAPNARTRKIQAYCRQLMMSTKAGFSEAPPTRKPSISASWLSSLQFFSLTEPP